MTYCWIRTIMFWNRPKSLIVRIALTYEEYLYVCHTFYLTRWNIYLTTKNILNPASFFLSMVLRWFFRDIIMWRTYWVYCDWENQSMKSVRICCLYSLPVLCNFKPKCGIQIMYVVDFLVMNLLWWQMSWHNKMSAKHHSRSLISGLLSVSSVL